MTIDLYRFTSPMTPVSLMGVLSGRDQPQTYALGVSADLTPVLDAFDRTRSLGYPRATWDCEFLEPLHRSLSPLAYTQLCDMRFWHWLCTIALPEIVWYRWHGSVPTDLDTWMANPAIAGRFLGGRSLNGFSRNALARIWWCGELLHDPGEGYALAREVISNQDFYQSIFDREFALHPPAARACGRALKASSENERRRITRELNHYFTTIAVETLDEVDITRLIEEIK